MKRIIRSSSIVLVTAFVVACVTINVYFPEAAAERAADRFIQDVIGPDAAATDSQDQAASFVPGPSARLASMFLDFLVPSAHAQSTNIDIETPQINAIKERMSQRHREHLADWFEAGAIGLNNNGLVEIRDRSAVGLSERRQLEQVVNAENADRRAVYREIAIANGHPEWEDQIRNTFAQRWVANAKSGWYYQDENGNWQRK
ncbi:MAG: YdbL family protein [Wenzhouxiangellaceae bacterium]|nr:YdbL family protein [Wenzhouxiangellaceae bacterium]